MLRRLFGEKCYDTQKKKVYYLYKSEIDGSFIRANITNSELGIVWIKAAELKQSDEIRHPNLNEEQGKYVREIMDNLNGVYDLSYEEWELGFRKDMDIDKNIAIFWFFSTRLRLIKESLILDAGEKSDLFKMMMAIMNNGPEFATNNLVYSGQVEKMKLELVRRFTAPDKEIA